jgi:hypothetical protein
MKERKVHKEKRVSRKENQMVGSQSGCLFFLPFVFRIVKEAVPLAFSLVGHPNLPNEKVSDHVKRIKGQKTFKLRLSKNFLC